VWLSSWLSSREAKLEAIFSRFSFRATLARLSGVCVEGGGGVSEGEVKLVRKTFFAMPGGGNTGGRGKRLCFVLYCWHPYMHHESARSSAHSRANGADKTTQ
jgi:hypothetical protein